MPRPRDRGDLQLSPDADLTYSEIGATAHATLPRGYRHLDERRVVGCGSADFESAAERLLTREMHRRAGLEVAVEAPRVRAGQTARLRLRLGPLRIAAPVRVVLAVDEPGERGFAYGTLPGHPESGEERFTVHLLDTGEVEARIRAFSRPVRWYSRLAGPVGRAVQDRVTRRYLQALT